MPLVRPLLAAGALALVGCADPIAPPVVPDPAGPLTLSRPALRAGAGDTVRLHLRHADSRRPADIPVRWRTTDPAVAVVEDSGLVVVLGPGSTEVVAVTADGTELRSTVTATGTARLSALSLAPTALALDPGDTAQVHAHARFSNGLTLPLRTSVRWSLPGTVATVTSTGLVRANAPGTGTLTATLSTLSATAAVAVSGSAIPTERVGHHVTPTGTAAGLGTATSPWSLARALAHPSSVAPGDTIWLHGGTYRGALTSRLTGTATRPVIVRVIPGERAVLDGNLVVEGAHTWYWGLEVTSTVASPIDLMAVNVYAPGARFINMIVHDAGGNGFGLWAPAQDAEVYGSIVYNNGRQRLDGGYAHGIYAQNATGTQRYTDNVLFNQFGYGFHMYAGSGSLVGFHLDGNVAFENGRSASARGTPEILVGGGTPADRVTLTGNMTFKSSGEGTGVQLGYNGTSSRSMTLRDNYLVGGKPALRLLRWAQATVTGNTLIQPDPWEMVWIEGSTSGYSWSGNMHYRAASDPRAWYIAPTAYDLAGFNARLGANDRSLGTTLSGTRVFVRPNRYESGRAHVVAYNWDRAPSVTADLSGVLAPGDTYEVRNVRDLFGAPLVTGTYAGAPISLPMTAVPSPRPVGGWVGPAPESMIEFQTFLITRRSR